jgi:TolB-like protein
MKRVERVAGAKHNRSLQLNGARCMEVRQRLGFSREALSERALGSHPLSVATIKRAEQGQPIYLGTASRLADVLQVPLQELVGTDSDASRAPLARQPRLAAIAVLPFRPWGDDAAYFADGLAEDLLTRLSRWWFPVIARSSAFTAASAEIPQIGEELGADYIVSGSVRRDGDQVRVSIRLALASNGQLLWAHAYDRRLASIFAAQDELTMAMVNSISTWVLETEARRHTGREPSDMNTSTEGAAPTTWPRATSSSARFAWISICPWRGTTW